MAPLPLIAQGDRVHVAGDPQDRFAGTHLYNQVGPLLAEGLDVGRQPVLFKQAAQVIGHF